MSWWRTTSASRSPWARTVRSRFSEIVSPSSGVVEVPCAYESVMRSASACSLGGGAGSRLALLAPPPERHRAEDDADQHESVEDRDPGVNPTQRQRDQLHDRPAERD